MSNNDIMDIRTEEDILNALICGEDSFSNVKYVGGDICVSFGGKTRLGLTLEEFRDMGHLYYVIKVKE